MMDEDVVRECDECGTAWHVCAHEVCPACADGDAEAVANTRKDGR